MRTPRGTCYCLVATPTCRGRYMTTTESKLKVMLVDDHTIVRQTLAEVIANQPDMELVGQAQDGGEALVMAMQQRPHIVVMDISMPGMSGLDATLRMVVDLPQTKVVGLSMHTAPDMERLMRAVGAS